MAKRTRKTKAQPQPDAATSNLQLLDAELQLAWETKLGRAAGPDSDGASLLIFDGQSGECVVEIQLTARQLGRLVASHSRVPVRADWQPIVRPAIKALVSPHSKQATQAHSKQATQPQAQATQPDDEPGVGPPREPGKAYLEVVNIRTKKIARRLDMTGKPEIHVDRVERGMLINMSDDYFVDRIGC